MAPNHPLILIVGIAVLTIITAFLVDPIPQDLDYHQFADRRHLVGIPNFFNVVSNLPFIIVGLVGIVTLSGANCRGILTELKPLYRCFFLGVLLTGFGSSWYHLNPTNDTLVWDRLPMTLSFMPLFAIVWGEFVDHRTARLLFIPLLLLGITSVLYWDWSETEGAGDLRLYALVQFLPMLLIPFILVLYKPKLLPSHYYWWLILWYLLSKLAEHWDDQIYAITRVMSGHTLKHLFAAVAAYIFCLALLWRKMI